MKSPTINDGYAHVMETMVTGSLQKREPRPFSSCLEQLEKIGTAEQYGKNHYLAKRGRVPDCCYLVKSGQVVGFEELPSGEELYRHMAEVCHAVNLPVMIQYAPEQTGVAIAPAVFERLSKEAPNAVYYKIECKPAGKYITTLLENAAKSGADMRIFVGNAGYQMIETLDRGALGLMPGCSMWDVYIAAYNAYMAGDRKEAKRIHTALLEILNHIRQNVEMIICYEKRILARRGIIATDVCRDPAFGTDRYVDALFDEYYEMISYYFVV